MKEFAFLEERDDKINVSIMSISKDAIIKGSLVEEIIKKEDIALIPESFKILSQFAGSLRDDLFDYIKNKNKNVEFPLLSNFFCYAFAKGVEFAYLWGGKSEMDFKFDYNAEDAIENNITNFVVDEIAGDIVIGLEKAHNVFCDLQKVIIDRRYPFYQGGRIFADLLAGSFFWATQIGIDYGINMMKNRKISVVTEDLTKYPFIPTGDDEEYDENEDIMSSFKTDLLKELFETGSKDGYVQNTIPFVPELTNNLKNLVIEILAAINNEEPGTSSSTSIAWCCFSGIGATSHWYINWEELKKIGIFNILTRERGISAMDEYVFDLIGEPIQTQKGGEIIKHIQKISALALVKMAMFYEQLSDQDKEYIFFQTYEAMYIYGMAIELNRLGMH